MNYNPFRLLGIQGLFTGRGERTRVKDVPYGIKYDKSIPKGCRMYYFDHQGVISPTKTSSHNICVMALNEKNARRKFKNLEIEV